MARRSKDARSRNLGEAFLSRRGAYITHLFLLCEIVGQDDLLSMCGGQVLDVLERHRRRADPGRLGVAVKVQHRQLHT